MSVEFLTLAEGSVAYQRQVGDKNKAGVVFLGGFASDMTGTKAAFLAERCAVQSIPFIRFDYRGCGQSPGAFADGTIGGWTEDALAVFDRLTSGPQIVIGSSMGGWIGLILAQARAARVKAFIGIAAAPDFTEDLVWNKLTDAQRAILLRDKQIYEEGGYAPITLKLIGEAREHLLLRAPLNLQCPVRLLQGKKDAEVPWDYAQRIADLMPQGDVRVTLIEKGDHRLSMPDDLEMLWSIVAAFV